MIDRIRAAEQQVRDTEARYSRIIEALRPKQPRWDVNDKSFRRLEHAVLGEIDGVPVIEVGRHSKGVGDHDRVAREAVVNGQDYAWVASNLSWHGNEPIKRTVKLATEIPHAFGIVEQGQYNPPEVGIYVPTETLIEARKRHGEEVLRGYPTLKVSLEQIRDLNISSDFVYRIFHSDRFDVNVPAGYEPIEQGVSVIPVVDSGGYLYSKNPQELGFADKVTELYIAGIPAPQINLDESLEGKTDPLLEAIRTSIGARGYQWTEVCEEGINSFMFRFPRVLTPKEIAEALEKLGKPHESGFEVTLHRLSDSLRDLVNLPLNTSFPAQFIEEAVEEDFKSGKRPWDWSYLSISMY